MIDAETRLLDLSRRFDAPTLDVAAVQMLLDVPDAQGRILGDDQAQALLSVATSRRVLDVLVGPAGAGKTTALSALRTAWEGEHGPGSVVGLAPSAAAAQVLGEDLNIPTENTAKWLWDHNHAGISFQAGQLVIVDEASLAGTFTLDRIASLAADAGAKVLLVGDWAQLGAIEAGGAFDMLVHARDDAPELADIHRFHEDWEKVASLELRHSKPGVISDYETHGRITGGDQDAMTDAAWQAWHTDITAGRSSVLIADNHQLVDALNQHARENRIQTGHVNPAKAATLSGGVQASIGDVVITRCNDRRLVAGDTGWVRNGDRWTISRVHDDGAVTLRRAGYRFGASVVLPAPYVAEHLDLGYAVTAHRAQGITVDTSHVLVTESMTRENLYVGLTRGRQNNHAWVAVDQVEAESHQRPVPATAASVLEAVLHNTGAEPSAHQTAIDEHERWNRIDHLVAMHQEIYQAAMADRWATLIEHCGLDANQTQQVLESDAYRPLCNELTRMDTTGYSPEKTLPMIVASRPVDDVKNVAAILYRRVQAVNNNPGPHPIARRSQPYVLGLVPQATGPIRHDMKTSLTEIENRIRQRANELTKRAIDNKEPWLATLGHRPFDAQPARLWDDAVTAIAAYRERWNIKDPQLLGQPTTNPTQRLDATRIQRILTNAKQVTDAARATSNALRQDSQRPTLT